MLHLPIFRPRPLAVALVMLLTAWPRSSQADGPTAAEAHALRTRIEDQLVTELTRHWYPNAVDLDQGGFHQDFARDWTLRPDTHRSLVYQSRLTWTAAAFAEFDQTRRDEYLGYARHGVAALAKQFFDGEGGGFHWILKPDGSVDPEQGTQQHVYGTAFALYAASQAYAATKDEKALIVARSAFAWLEQHAHDGTHGGFHEAFERNGTPILAFPPGAPIHQRTDRLGVYFGFKSMNAHIHLLEALAGFYRVEPIEAVRERLEEVFLIVRDKIAVAPGALNLYFTRDWKPTAAHDSFGHDIETAYLLVEAADALGRPDDAKTWDVARSLVDHALDWGWDAERGGFYDKGDVFAGQAYDQTKVWWTQAEGLNALMVMHAKFGARTDRYWQAFLKQWQFIERHQLDLQFGGWFNSTSPDGQPIGDLAKATPWKANYHTSRALMNVARHLRRIETQTAAQGAPPESIRGAFSPPAALANDLGDYRSPLRFDDGRPVRTPAEWAERRQQIQANWHRLMGPWPAAIERPKVEVLETVEREGLTQRKLKLGLASDRDVDGYLLVPQGDESKKRAAVLVVFYEPETSIGQGGAGRDFGLQLARRGFVTLSIGIQPRGLGSDQFATRVQPLSYLAHVASNAYNALAAMPGIDPQRIAVMGHSYGGKWAMFAACLDDRFACGVWSDPGIAFDEARPNVNYWDPWYLGWAPAPRPKSAPPFTDVSPRLGAYRALVAGKHDLHELQALMAPRPFLVSGGSEDPVERWRVLNHVVAVNRLLGQSSRVAMTNRPGHDPTPESNLAIATFLEFVLKP